MGVQRRNVPHFKDLGIKRDPGRSSTFTLHHAHLKKAILHHKRALVKTEVVTTVGGSYECDWLKTINIHKIVSDVG